MRCSGFHISTSQSKIHRTQRHHANSPSRNIWTRRSVLSRMDTLRKLSCSFPRSGNFVRLLGMRGLLNNAPFPLWRYLVTSLIALTLSTFLPGSCIIAFVPQPYTRAWQRRTELKPLFRARWSDIVNTVLRLRVCLSPRTGRPSGGYTPLASRSTSDRDILPDELTRPSHYKQASWALYVYD